MKGVSVLSVVLYWTFPLFLFFSPPCCDAFAFFFFSHPAFASHDAISLRENWTDGRPGPRDACSRSPLLSRSRSGGHCCEDTEATPFPSDWVTMG